MRKKTGAAKGARPRRDRVKEQPKDLASIWKAKAEEIEEYPVIEREFGGLPCKVRLMPIRAWIRAGHMPAFLATEYAQTLAGIRPSETAAAYTNEQQEEFLLFQRIAVCETLVEPRLVLDREPKAGEFRYEWALVQFPKTIDELQAWILRGCPGIPIQTKGGALTTDELSNFREGKVVPDDVPASGSATWQTQPSPRNL
jgi:hypothetical protein